MTGEAALNVGCYHTVRGSRLYDDDLLVFYPLKENLGDFITYEPWRKMRNCIKVSNLMQKLQLQNRCFKNTFDRILLRVHFLNFNTFVHFKLTVYLRNSTMLCLFL